MTPDGHPLEDLLKELDLSRVLARANPESLNDPLLPQLPNEERDRTMMSRRGEETLRTRKPEWTKRRR